ncbi:MAG: DUF935 domain-containing protein [Phenylobacterium sp.]|uniref:DUF935 domain-containing protein n=1 Tax=Phenylobacterium sp. TaxID=1871053 RepID=UPI0039189098
MAETEAVPAKPEMQEIATSADGRDITKPYFGPLLEPEDTVLRGLGGRWEAYREIRRDGQVHSTFQQRRLAIVARPLIVEPGADDAASKAAAQQLQENLDAIAFNRATKGMSWGLFYGFSVGECMWEVRDNKVWLKTVKVRTPWRFRFTPDGQLRLLTRKDAFRGEQLPDRKFWVMSSGADNDDDPYGLGLAFHLYWPVYFKKMGLSFWLRALEKFGAPTTVGTYPAGTSAADQAKLLAAAMAIRLDGAVIKPEGTVLEMLEAKRGTVDQATFYRFCNSDISKVVLGQTMTTDDGASLSQSEVHMDVREELTDADVEELCESFEQGPARWLTEWNYPGAATPKLRRPSPEDAERASKLTKEKAETYKTMREAGFEPEDARLAEDFPGWRRRAPPQLVAAPAPEARPAFAEAAIGGMKEQLRAMFAEAAPPDAIEAFVDELDWEPLIEPVVAAAEEIVRTSPTLEAAGERLVGLYGSPVFAEFTERLAEAVFQARMAGEAGLGLSDREDRAQAAAG